MKVPFLSNSSLNFLEELKKNNDREWFNAHKAEFIAEQEKV